MDYVALYRKYRPKTFSDVIGQENVVAILKNQISMDKIAHAYLFSGTRGTGKTSVAKIFARGVNCTQTKDGEPCNQCQACLEMESNSVMDIIEIDAASNRGVDEIRELRDKVKYMPALGRFKVYIIDEVHMLTMEAFNALLKTLEEPPKHVIFILATTEPNKLPATILSRCQRFQFKRLTPQQIMERTRYVAQDVGLDVEEGALQLIAKNADGAMRDALSILDQCVSISDDSVITYEEVRETLGITDNEILFDLMEAIWDKDPVKGLHCLEEAYTNGREMGQLIHQLIGGFRDLLVYTLTKNMDLLAEIKDESQGLLQKVGPGDTKALAHIIQVLAERESKLKFTTLPKVLMEVTLVYLCEGALPDETPTAVVKEKPQTYRATPEKAVPKAKPVTEPTSDPTRPAPKTSNGEQPSGPKGKDDGKGFETFRKQVMQEKKVTGSALLSAKGHKDGNTLILQYPPGEEFGHQIALDDQSFLQETAKKLFGSDTKLRIEIHREEEDFMKVLPLEIFGEDIVEFQ